jgi:hypothetical protein
MYLVAQRTFCVSVNDSFWLTRLRLVYEPHLNTRVILDFLMEK